MDLKKYEKFEGHPMVDIWGKSIYLNNEAYDLFGGRDYAILFHTLGEILIQPCAKFEHLAKIKIEKSNTVQGYPYKIFCESFFKKYGINGENGGFVQTLTQKGGYLSIKIPLDKYTCTTHPEIKPEPLEPEKPLCLRLSDVVWAITNGMRRFGRTPKASLSSLILEMDQMDMDYVPMFEKKLKELKEEVIVVVRRDFTPVISRAESVRRFREQWRLMAKGELVKEQAYNSTGGDIKCNTTHCHLCDFAGYSSGILCENFEICPIDWGQNYCFSFETYFCQWKNSHIDTERNALAAKIAELPEKKERFFIIDINKYCVSFLLE
jgi:hypothetical protein